MFRKGLVNISVEWMLRLELQEEALDKDQRGFMEVGFMEADDSPWRLLKATAWTIVSSDI